MEANMGQDSAKMAQESPRAKLFENYRAEWCPLIRLWRVYGALWGAASGGAWPSLILP